MSRFFDPWRRSLAAPTLGLVFALSVGIARGASADEGIEPLPSIFDGEVQPAAIYSSYLYAEESPAAEADDESALAERLAALEGKYDDLDKSYGELSDKYDELKKKMKVVAYSGHGDATMKVNGRIHADYWAYPGDSPGVNAFETGNPAISPQDRFGFRRARFGVKGELWQTMEYKIEMEFAAGNNVEFRDVYLGWHDVPFFQTVLVGNQKRPYGLDHINSSRFNVFMERPFVIEGFNQDSRRLGIAAYGFSDDQRWNFRYGVYNLQLVQAIGSYTSDHYQGEVAGRLANTFWYDEASGGRGYGHWAISGTAADPDGSNTPGRAPNQAQFRTRPEARTTSRWLDTGVIAGADSYQLLGLENVWNFGPLQLVGEYQNVWLQRTAANELQFNGAYVYAAYFLTGEHMVWDRERGELGRTAPLENFFLVDTCCDGVQAGWGAWQLAYRWSYADFTDDNIAGGVGESHTLGLNWLWNPYARMQFNAAYGDISQHAAVAGQTAGHYTYIGTRFMVDF